MWKFLFFFSLFLLFPFCTFLLSSFCPFVLFFFPLFYLKAMAPLSVLYDWLSYCLSTKFKSFLGEFVKFQPITLVPFEPKLIDPKLMSVRQLEWLNMYNQEILGKVLPKITVNDDRTLAWIRARTEYFSPALSFEVQKYKDEI